MTVTELPTAAREIDLPSILGALEFEAPYVVERLVNDRIVDTEAEGIRLFGEVKRYLVLSVSQTDVIVGMCSARVDEGWHAFLLYTYEYRRFCQRYFGRFVGHAPKNSPKDAPDDRAGRPKLSFDGFRDRYEEFFGEPLPDVWYDRRCVAPSRRMFNDLAANMTVRRRDSIVDLIDESGTVVLSVNDIALPALTFITRTGSFYVRELTGDLTDDEKVALVESLLMLGIVRIAP